MGTENKNYRISKIRYSVLLLILSVSSVLTFFSCTPQSCYDETNAYVKLSFYNNEGTRKSPDSLTIYGVGMYYARLYNKATNVQPALLPLNASTGQSIFVVRINGINDTLTLNYTSFPHLISKECGYAFYHTIDSVVPTYNKITSIGYTKKSITTLNEENIRIYY